MNAVDARGFVSLVGAGPGDPDLITVGGAARLVEADVIIYDRLANPALLKLAEPDAELIAAGKSPDHHTLTQDQINQLLVEKAREGKRVVRLKGGDPFVFGRGGEEAEALAAAGIPFEVLPGVTSAIGGPAYAGIPVTHRAVASSFAVVTAHEDADKHETSIDWPKLATSVDTLIILMGSARLEDIARRLVEHGRPADTPAAIVEWGTLPRQRTVTASLATIADRASADGIAAPAVIVVGEVARLRDKMRWFDARPLVRKRVLVTRTREQASELSRLLARHGAEAIELPTIELHPCANPPELEHAISGLRSSLYTWVIFTSANAVEQFLAHLRDASLDARAFARARLAAIGPGTDAALERHALRADIVPERFVAEGLLEALARHTLRGQHVLLPRAVGARPVLVEGLEAMGAQVDELKLYEAVVPQDPNAEGLRRLYDGEVDIVTFASSSAVRNLVQMLRGDVEPLRRPLIAAIGPITAQAVRDVGLKVSVMPEKHTVEALVAALLDHYEPSMASAR